MTMVRETFHRNTGVIKTGTSMGIVLFDNPIIVIDSESSCQLYFCNISSVPKQVPQHFSSKQCAVNPHHPTERPTATKENEKKTFTFRLENHPKV